MTAMNIYRLVSNDDCIHYVLGDSMEDALDYYRDIVGPETQDNIIEDGKQASRERMNVEKDDHNVTTWFFPMTPRPSQEDDSSPY